MGEIHLQALTKFTTLNDYLEQWASCLTAGKSRHRVTGLKDAIPFVKVMDEALAAYQGELDRMGVKVCRKYQFVGEGILEASKLLHILVILIWNAINRMRERTGRAHHLIRYVLPCPDREGFVHFQVAATGSGISLDCLTRVYSRKDTGHRIYSEPSC